MKKFAFLSGILLLTVVILFASCQKDESATIDSVAVSSEGKSIGLSGTNPTWSGAIAPSYAAALAANYVKKYDDDNQTQYVSFSIDDLVAYLNNLKKNGSTSVYVNFGVYGPGAKPVNAKDYGKLTVFFTGNKISAPSTSGNGKKNNGFDTPTDEFLNHGNVWP